METIILIYGSMKKGVIYYGIMEDAMYYGHSVIEGQ